MGLLRGWRCALPLAGLAILGSVGCGRNRADRTGSFADTPGYAVVIDTTLAWSDAEADSARALQFLFPVERAGAAHRLRVLAVPAGGAAQRRVAHLRARILRPGGRHLIGLDVRLFPEKHGSFPIRRHVWPEGGMTFQPERKGWYRLELVRRGLEVRRARVRIESELFAPSAAGSAPEPEASRAESTAAR